MPSDSAASAGFASYPSLRGRVVMVTGGASGIGAAMVRAFVEQGATVGFVDRDAVAAGKLLQDLQGADAGRPTAWFGKLDVTDVAALKAAVADFAARSGSLDVLVNNVADDMRHDPAMTTVDAWRAGMAVNLDAAFFATQAAIPLMKGRGGTIVNLGSINALTGPPDMPGYVAAKSALLGLTKALARQYGPDNVRVNCILPGWVVTDRQLDLWLTPEAEAEWMKGVALQRRIMPADVARLALFLASDDSAMITGQHFVIDGGRT
jgi:NAD(P)-dependent dehydrogenase (short-subunit alcohol dehydrogenase family)